jgi:hypothetical protein
MNYADIFAAGSLVWPLAFILVALFALRQAGEAIQPIASSIVKGVAQNAGSNATAYAIAIMFGLSASLSAFYDVFNELTKSAFDVLSFHQYLALWAKVANPFVVAVLAYATQNKFSAKSNGSATNPPIAPSSP